MPLPVAAPPVARGSMGNEPQVPLSVLTSLAANLAADVRRWQPHVRHDPTERWAHRFCVSRGLDAWLLGWTGGQAVPLHDHGRSHGTICPVEGTLVETRWDDGTLTVDLLDRGVVRAVESGTVHGVANLHDAPATSIHVYSPPLSVMSYFEHAPSGLRATRAEPVSVVDVG